jgi:Catalytic LigB subunit of aromatic ring-opening dioxygenase
MAQIVVGVATPHAPQVRLPIEGWYALREKDETDRRIDYAGLLSRAKPDMDQELADSRLRERCAAIASYRDQLAQVLAAAKPDVLVVVGDDQHEQFHEDLMPMFCVYRGESVEVARRTHGVRAGSQTWNAAKLDEIQEAVADQLNVYGEHACAPALAEHLIDSLRNDGFDIAASNHMNPAVGLGHAFTFMYEFMLPSGDIPMVPVMVNTFFPPNQPTPARCYALGEALRRSIDAWDSDQRVAVVASGGLSHTIVDEEIDRATLDGVLEKDAQALRNLPRERLNLGTSEIRNWIALAGAMEPNDVHLIGDYVPAYRSPAGTGCGFAFAYWD